MNLKFVQVEHEWFLPLNFFKNSKEFANSSEWNYFDSSSWLEQKLEVGARVRTVLMLTLVAICWSEWFPDESCFAPLIRAVDHSNDLGEISRLDRSRSFESKSIWESSRIVYRIYSIDYRCPMRLSAELSNLLTNACAKCAEFIVKFVRSSKFCWVLRKFSLRAYRSFWFLVFGF